MEGWCRRDEEASVWEVRSARWGMVGGREEDEKVVRVEAKVSKGGYENGLEFLYI